MRSDIERTTLDNSPHGAWADLPLHIWETLPLPIRLQDRLAEILVLIDELRAEFRDEAGGALQWVNVEVERMGDEVEALLDRLAS